MKGGIKKKQFTHHSWSFVTLLFRFLGADLLHPITSSSTLWFLALEFEGVLANHIIDHNLDILTILILEVDTLIVILRDHVKVVVSVTNPVQESCTLP